MSKSAGAFVWLGGAAFVGALAFCGYTYAIRWSNAPAFDPRAVPIDALLFSIFALHHSLFARDAVKRSLARIVPDSLMRSVYVWFASLLLVLVCVAWEPVGGELYHHHGIAALAHALAQLLGAAIIFEAVRTIDALELAGIRLHPTAGTLQIGGPYRFVRHPLYSGWVLLTFGGAHMTGDRLTFAAISTIYLILAMPFEERALRSSFGRDYAEYARRVRYRLVPYVY